MSIRIISKLTRSAGAVAMATTVLSVACSTGAGPSKLGTQPTWRSSGAVTDDSGATAENLSPAGGSDVKNPTAPAPSTPATAGPPTPSQPTVFTPKTPSVDTYNASTMPPLPRSELYDAIVEGIRAFCKESGIASPTPDPRLYRAADDMAAVVPEDTPLSYSIIEFAMQRHGIVEPSPHMLPVAGSLDDPNTMLDQLAERLSPVLAEGDITRLGIGSARGALPGHDVLVIILQASHVQTVPIPRSFAANARFVVEGRALHDYRDPELYITQNDGSVRSETLKRRGRQGFRAELSCQGFVGRQQIEITAENQFGSSVLANFPIWCGQKPPATLTVEPSVDDLVTVTTTGDAEALMLRLVNEDRAKYNLPPLAMSSELSDVARAHSEDMKHSGIVAHVSPTTGTAQDRVEKANIATSMIMENIARAYGVGEAQAGLMNSPGHRTNLLNDKATHLGVGIAFKGSESEGRIMFITQLFMRVPPKLSIQEARAQLQQAIATSKRQVTASDVLSVVAQGYVDTVVVPDLSAASATRWRTKHFNALRGQFARVATAVVVVSDLETIDMDDAFSDPWITHYGIGVAKGPDPKYGDDALHIVLVLAQAR